MEKLTVSSQDMLSFSHENFAAFMKSGQIWTKGLEESMEPVKVRMMHASEKLHAVAAQ